MDFEEYNGWPNFPTWDTFSALSSYYDTYQELRQIADRSTTPNDVKRFVLGAVEAWKANRYNQHQEATRIVVQDFIMSGIRHVDWTAVLDALRGARTDLNGVNEVTALTYTLLSQADWESIIEGAESLTDADTLLQDWLQDQCITWIESPDARRHRGPVAQFANTVLDVYFSVVDWEKLTEAFRES